MGIQTENSVDQPNRIVGDIPCPFCACLCDDLQATESDGRVTQIERACELARPWFLGEATAERPVCRIGGKPATTEDAIVRAAALLKAARYPLVYGLSRATCEAQGLAVEIADLIAGVLDTPADRAALDALQSVGDVTCTLGEIRNRGDLIVAWNIDPTESHPRFFERYSPLVPSRALVAVGPRATALGGAGVERIELREGGDFDAATTLIALAKGVSVDDNVVTERTGTSLSVWGRLLERMQAARYGVLLYGESGDQPAGRAARVTLARFVRLLNDQTRFALFTLPAASNSVGAANVLTWRTGYPMAIDMSRGTIESNHNEIIAGRLLAAGEFDAALVICDDLPSDHVAPALSRRKIPLVAIDWRSTPTMAAADVAIPLAVPGVESGGTMFRCDGVPLALRPPVSSPLPADHQLLRSLAEALHPSKQLLGSVIRL
jgi:formylmethanofuran dehydrogenase subunit B